MTDLLAELLISFAGPLDEVDPAEAGAVADELLRRTADGESVVAVSVARFGSGI